MYTTLLMFLFFSKVQYGDFDNWSWYQEEKIMFEITTVTKCLMLKLNIKSCLWF